MSCLCSLSFRPFSLHVLPRKCSFQLWSQAPYPPATSVNDARSANGPREAGHGADLGGLRSTGRCHRCRSTHLVGGSGWVDVVLRRVLDGFWILRFIPHQEWRCKTRSGSKGFIMFFILYYSSCNILCIMVFHWSVTSAY